MSHRPNESASLSSVGFRLNFVPYGRWLERGNVSVKYSKIPLSISPEQAAKIVSESVSGIRRTQEGNGYVYRTNSGTTLAILASDDGGEGAVLRYRTTIISPQLATARRKAREIKNALSEYQARPQR